MGRWQMHFAKYMGSYVTLMAVSCLLWHAAGLLSGSGADAAAGQLAVWLGLASDFLIDFAVAAYPLYAANRFLVKRLLRRFGTHGFMRGGSAARDRDGVARSSFAS